MSLEVYKLVIGDYYYIGSGRPERFIEHKYKCFAEKYRNYNTPLYKFIRSQGITKDTFYDNVKKVVLFSGLKNKLLAEKVENAYINLEDEYCINKKKSGIDYKNNINEYHNKWNKKQHLKMFCEPCDYKAKKLTKKQIEIHCNTLKHQYNMLMWID